MKISPARRIRLVPSASVRGYMGPVRGFQRRRPAAAQRRGAALIDRGLSAFLQIGHEIEPRIVIRPGRVAFAEANQSIGVSIPYETLTPHIPHPEAIFGRRVAANAGFAQLVSCMLRALWTQAERGLPSEFGPGLAKNLLELLATAYAIDPRAAVSESSVQCARRAQIKRFIERRLRDADLNAQAVAEGLRLSPRYIRRLFATEGESVSDYILRRRLEECARQLTSALWQGRSITDTAFEWGFSSMAHFTRAFKDRFAVTPSDFRRSRAS